MNQRISTRFQKLSQDAVEIKSIQDLKKFNHAFFEWQMKCQQILNITCGENSNYAKTFFAVSRNAPSTRFCFDRLVPIFNAAKDDLENGFLISMKLIIQSEVFDNELEQAQHLLTTGYKAPAAVIGGVVLETALKQLAINNDISIENKRLARINDDLTKAQIYNSLQQKQIIVLADIRNSAAHGKNDDFTKEDVERMLNDIQNILLNYFK